MKLQAIVPFFFTLVSAAAHAHAIPDGSYHGQGLWKSIPARGTYQVSTTVKGDQIASTYKFNGEERAFTIELQDSQNGFLRAVYEGKEVGQGYCLENVTLCHFSVKTDKLALEETLTIQNGKLYAFGSKTVDGLTVMWQESLEK
jgi:hypothetical protein